MMMQERDLRQRMHRSSWVDMNQKLAVFETIRAGKQSGNVKHRSTASCSHALGKSLRLTNGPDLTSPPTSSEGRLFLCGRFCLVASAREYVETYAYRFAFHFGVDGAPIWHGYHLTLWFYQMLHAYHLQIRQHYVYCRHCSGGLPAYRMSIFGVSF